MIDKSPPKQNENININMLNKHCLNEIENNLKYIQSCLDESKTDKNTEKSFVKILDSCQTIEDLAMIYGYQGIENLAANITAAVTSIVKGEQRISKQFVKKLGIAVQGIRSMSGIDDDQLVNSIVNSTISRIVNYDSQPSEVARKRKKVPAKPLNHINAENKSKNNVPQKDESSSIFRIQEEKTIQNLIDLIEKNQKVEDTREDNTPLDLAKQQLDNKEIEKVFNTIFIEETQENLKFLREALDAIVIGSTPGESVMRIKEACSSLKDSAASFRIIDLQDTFEKLYRITNVYLNFSKPPSSDVVDLIKYTTDTLTDYLHNKNRDINPVNQKLENFLKENKAIPEKEAPQPDKSEEVIQVIDELQMFPKPKKKKIVKVKFNEDDDNVRWISKFK